MDILYLTSIKEVQFKAFRTLAKQFGHNIHLLGGQESYQKDFAFQSLHSANSLFRFKKWLSRTPFIHSQYYLRAVYPGTKKTIKPDIIHAIGANSWGILATSNQSTSCPLVITCQGNDIYRYPFQRKKNFARIKQTLHQADLVHVLSDSTTQYLIDVFDLPADKITASYWGIDVADINEILRDADIESIKQHWGIAERDTVIFAPRGMRPEFRPIESYLSAILPLLRKNENIKLIIMMHGHDKSLDRRVRNLIKNTGLNQKAIFINEFQTHQDIIGLMLLSDITISLAENDETCSAILEAMYCGAIPVLSATPTYLNRFEDKKNVYFIDNSKMHQAVSMLQEIISELPALKQKISPINKHVILENFNRQANLKGLQSMYENLVRSYQSGS